MHKKQEKFDLTPWCIIEVKSGGAVPQEEVSDMSLKVEKKDAAKAHSGATKTQSRRYPLAPLSNNGVSARGGGLWVEMAKYA